MENENTRGMNIFIQIVKQTMTSRSNSGDVRKKTHWLSEPYMDKSDRPTLPTLNVLVAHAVQLEMQPM